MPLVILCGVPCSGKTTVTNELVQVFRDRGICKKIQIINEESLLLNRKECYASSLSERKARDTLKAAVERVLSKDCLVICDSLNYVKGFRYELFCKARTMLTLSCVVYCENNDTLEFNRGYEDDVCKDLVRRMEVPNENVKWDKPLFRVSKEMVTGLVINEKKQDWFVLLESIINYLTSNGHVAATLASVPSLLRETNYLFDFDRLTQTVEKGILAAQSENRAYRFQSTQSVADDEKYEVVSVEFSRKLTLPELRRIRQLFITICKQKPPVGTETTIVQLFIGFIQKNMDI